MLATGHNPVTTYTSIFNGTGLNWLFPWVGGAARTTAAGNLQQTLLQATPLILIGLAVAFAFRAGMFNIGGQGQYTVGGIAAVWIASSFSGMSPVLHIAFAIVGRSARGRRVGRDRRGAEGVTGANEVISTIMLNWIAIWLGVYCFQLGGPLQNPHQPNTPVSSNVVQGAKLPVFWGNASAAGTGRRDLHRARARRRLRDPDQAHAVRLRGADGRLQPRGRALRGDQRRADLGPRDARSAARSPASPPSLDILGWKFSLFTNDIQTSQIGFYGIAVALLGRNTASGTVAAAHPVRGAADRDVRSQHPPQHRPHAGAVPDVHDRGDHHPARLDRRDHAPPAARRAADRRGAETQAPANLRHRAPAGRRERRLGCDRAAADDLGAALRDRRHRPRGACMGGDAAADRGSRHGRADRPRRHRDRIRRGRGTRRRAEAGDRDGRRGRCSRSPVPPRRRTPRSPRWSRSSPGRRSRRRRSGTRRRCCSGRSAASSRSPAESSTSVSRA